MRLSNTSRSPPTKSALGQKQTYAAQQVMSALPPKADMCSALAYVCFGPIADARLDLLWWRRKRKRIADKKMAAPRAQDAACRVD